MNNPYYREDLADECREFMLISIRLMLAYLETHPTMVSADIVMSLDPIVEMIEDDNATTKEIATVYESFYYGFSRDTNVFEQICKLPLLFLAKELES